MCLFFKNGKNNKETSDEDKIVYKVFMAYEYIKGSDDKQGIQGVLLLNSPYLTHHYYKKYNVENEFGHSTNGISVTVGFHSFENLEDALVLKKYFDRREKEFSPVSSEFTHAIVLECVIPKGSEFYVGEFPHLAYATMPTSYCSKELIIKDQEVTLRNGKVYNICLE